MSTINTSDHTKRNLFAVVGTKSKDGWYGALVLQNKVIGSYMAASQMHVSWATESCDYSLLILYHISCD